MSRVGCYVDGFNLYHAIEALGRPDLKWLSLSTLARSYLRDRDTLEGVLYFTAVMKWNPEKANRHREYMRALAATGVEVVESKFLKSNKFCGEYQRWCDFSEEKQTDVAIAARVMSDVHCGRVNRALLFTADSDQIPLVRQVRVDLPDVSVEVVAPPGRMRQARELCAAATRFGELSPGRIGTCKFPRNVADDSGRVVARCPAAYLTGERKGARDSSAAGLGGVCRRRPV